MSFGIGIGDICLVIRGAWKGWDAIASYSQDSGSMREELALWRPALDKLSERLASQALSPEAAAMAQYQMAECYQLLDKIDKHLNGGSRKGTRRAKWALCDRGRVMEYMEAANRRMRSLETMIIMEMATERRVILTHTDNRLLTMPVNTRENAIQLVDAMGEEWKIPMQICRNWEALHTLLMLKFEGAKGATWVQARRYHITDETSGLKLSRANWEESLKPGMKISMAMVLHRENEYNRLHKCPRCNHPHPGTTSDQLERVRCAQCRTYFEVSSRHRITDLDDNDHEVTTPPNHPNGPYDQIGPQKAPVIDTEDINFFRRLHLSLYESEEFASEDEVWDTITTRLGFNRKEVDIDLLAIKLRSVTTVSESGVVIPRRDMLRILADGLPIVNRTRNNHIC